MNTPAFKHETFRDDYSFSNSAEAIRRFPFPFPEDDYMYSVNIEQHEPGAPGSVLEHLIDIDEHYLAECEDRRLTLEQDPDRCIITPHMIDAQWDMVELVMESLAADYPQWFSLSKNGDDWHWINTPMGIDQQFRFGDASTLPMPPFEFITRQVQGDWIIMDQRDDDLFADMGMVTSQADWSIAFDAGMSFKEWHGPVPQANEIGVFDRALKYLLHLQYGSPVRRLNWTMTVNPRLDTSPENYPFWGPDNVSVTPENVGDKVYLRVELQALFRLPRSNAIAFSVRGYLISLNELVTYPRWGKRLHRILKGLHPDLSEYKGLDHYRQTVIDWLAPMDDGADLGLGTQPE
ncbi:hypothetical protein MPL1_04687 [Methylophaga lonarensis MPL]|uniref:DUF3445 domain-containing protein n=1 Tax=Methylophaga lonarensis MPL TaxID=1286106 RepID=M7PSS5_9GAMM|nr:DUF3445 domain-containing protein [Methylophaga lonarensis]EMR13509.1 hypothetical protein MPL1_04687 [Methylophaga lonarensis MPL]